MSSVQRSRKSCWPPGRHHFFRVWADAAYHDNDYNRRNLRELDLLSLDRRLLPAIVYILVANGDLAACRKDIDSEELFRRGSVG